jgi:sodium/bile acid cotransporter 7
MTIAFVAALIHPALGADSGPLHLGLVTQVAVALVFFLHGAALSPEALKAGAGRWRLHVFIQAMTFLAFPLIGAGLYFGLLGVLPEELRLGFFFLCALSSTISSSVALVAMGDGNVPAAVFNATLSGLIGMIATPGLLALINFASAQPLPFLGAVEDIFLKLLLPFAIGQAARALFGSFADQIKPIAGKLDRLVILMIVYSAFCTSTLAGVWTRYEPHVVAMVFLLVATLLGLAIVLAGAGSKLGSKLIN